MKQSQLPPALRKPVTPTTTASAPPVTPSAEPSTPSDVSVAPTVLPKLDGWEPMALPPTRGNPASTPKPQPLLGPKQTPSILKTSLTAKPQPPSASPVSTPKISTTPRISNPRIPVLDRIAMFEGTFRYDRDKMFCVETPLTGNGVMDKATLVALARKHCPKFPLNLVSTRIFTRDPGTPATYALGATMGQLFGESGSDTETGIEVGHVFFQGERCQVFLRNLRSRNCVTIALRPPGGNSIVFSNQIGAGRLAKELGYVVKEILGNEARELEITLKEAK